MEQNFSFAIYKRQFDAYAARYDRNDGRVRLKIIHTEAVVSIMKRLCAMRNLSPHTASLALLCAQFHDVGRFEQLKQYDTFLDQGSVDHALLGCQVIEECHMLDSLTETDREMVLTAIRNHNRLEIDEAVTKAADSHAAQRLELCKLIRDADKCDIFRVFATDDMADVIGVPDEVVAGETVSPEVLDSIRRHRCVPKDIRKTHLDYWIGFLGFFFDFNYPESMALAKEQGYYRLPFERTAFQTPQAREQINEVFSILDAYIDERSVEKARETAAPSPDDATVPAPLRAFFREHSSLALAFSGGTDSAYLLYAAKRCGANVRAYYVSTPFQPEFELADAKRLAEELGADMTVLPFDVLTLPSVKANPADRCYYCKQAIFSRILKAAKDDGFSELMDGTNASDDAGDRPGMRALREMKVLSPLRLCGVTKMALRESSRSAGLFTWEKPAYACLATRVPAGIPLDSDVLSRVEEAENALSLLGFIDFRVRVFPDAAAKEAKNRAWCARIQVTENQLPLLFKKREAVLTRLRESFSAVLLDLDARKASL